MQLERLARGMDGEVAQALARRGFGDAEGNLRVLALSDLNVSEVRASDGCAHVLPGQHGGVPGSPEAC